MSEDEDRCVRMRLMLQVDDMRNSRRSEVVIDDMPSSLGRWLYDAVSMIWLDSADDLVLLSPERVLIAALACCDAKDDWLDGCVAEAIRAARTAHGRVAAEEVGVDSVSET